MTSAAINPGNVIVGEALLYTAPAPLRVPEPPVADTVAYGTIWTGNWTYVGATTDGVTFGVDRKTVDITVEEQPNPVDTPTDTMDITVACTLSEETVANMKLSLGGGTVTTQAPGASLVGKSTIAFSIVSDFLSVGFEGMNPDGFWTRFYIPVAKSAAKVSVAFRRAKAQRMWDVSFSAICAINAVTITEMTAVATS